MSPSTRVLPCKNIEFQGLFLSILFLHKLLSTVSICSLLFLFIVGSFSHELILILQCCINLNVSFDVQHCNTRQILPTSKCCRHRTSVFLSSLPARNFALWWSLPMLPILAERPLHKFQGSFHCFDSDSLTRSPLFDFAILSNLLACDNFFGVFDFSFGPLFQLDLFLTLGFSIFLSLS
uniref:Uncharacterized protein n=1 Tax=Solanum lycopersicum TaxID=4081 RepID=A0A3Q7EC74_SOLLC